MSVVATEAMAPQAKLRSDPIIAPPESPPGGGLNAPSCGNCKALHTPLWRRDENGNVLCNACGLFLKLHGRPRPISLKSDVIKSRNRVKASGVMPKRKSGILFDASTVNTASSNHQIESGASGRRGSSPSPTSMLDGPLSSSSYRSSHHGSSGLSLPGPASLAGAAVNGHYSHEPSSPAWYHHSPPLHPLNTAPSPPSFRSNSTGVSGQRSSDFFLSHNMANNSLSPLNTIGSPANGVKRDTSNFLPPPLSLGTNVVSQENPSVSSSSSSSTETPLTNGSRPSAGLLPPPPLAAQSTQSTPDDKSKEELTLVNQKLQTRVTELEFVNDLIKQRLADLEAASSQLSTELKNATEREKQLLGRIEEMEFAEQDARCSTVTAQRSFSSGNQSDNQLAATQKRKKMRVSDLVEDEDDSASTPQSSK